MTLGPRSPATGVTVMGAGRRATSAGLLAALITIMASVVFPAALAAQAGVSDPSELRVMAVDTSDHPEVELTVTVPSAFIDSGVDLSSVAITEDGDARPATVRAITGPVQLGLVIDTSASMHGDPLIAAAEAARACLGGLPAGSMAFLIAYSDHPIVTHEMSSDLASVSQGLERLVAVGETATHDALVVASAQFQAAAAQAAGQSDTGEPGGVGETELDRFVVLLSDGSDNTSQTPLRQATDRLIADEAAVYALALQTGETDIATLQQIAAETDGALITTTTADLVSHCTAIGRQVSNRYTVAYTSQSSAGRSGGGGTSAVDISLGSDGGGMASSSTIVDFGGGGAMPSDLIEAMPSGGEGGTWTPGQEGFSTAGSGALEIPTGSDVDGLGAAGGPPSSLAMGDPLDGAKGAGQSGRALWVGAGAMFAAMSTMFSVVLVPSQSAVTAKRLKLRVDVPKDTPTNRFGALSAVGEQISVVFDSILQRGGLGSSLNKSLDAAGVNLRPGEYVGMFVGGAIGAFFFLAAAGFGTMAPLAFVVVPLLGHFYLKRRSNKRLGAFQEQLVETLMIMSGSIRAGHGMMQSISSVADQAEDPTAAEFGRVITEVRIGRDPIDSLNAMAERVGSIDLTWTVRAMALNRELGGNLAEILDNVADTIRERNRIADQVRALSAEGKFSAYVLFGLPFGVVFAVRMLNAEYIEPLFNTSMGHKIIGVALSMMTVGAIWIKNMIKIEY